MSWKDFTKEALGSEYQDYNLVICGVTGFPVEPSTISEEFKKLIRENDLPEVVFHSLRHSSITYKLKLNGGDIKAVQGDSGHAQASMVTEQYSHVLTDGQHLLKLFRLETMLFETELSEIFENRELFTKYTDHAVKILEKIEGNSILTIQFGQYILLCMTWIKNLFDFVKFQCYFQKE